MSEHECVMDSGWIKERRAKANGKQTIIPKQHGHHGCFFSFGPIQPGNQNQCLPSHSTHNETKQTQTQTANAQAHAQAHAHANKTTQRTCLLRRCRNCFKLPLLFFLLLLLPLFTSLPFLFTLHCSLGTLQTQTRKQAKQQGAESG